MPEVVGIEDETRAMDPKSEFRNTKWSVQRLRQISVETWVVVTGLLLTLLCKLVIVWRDGPHFDAHADDRCYLRTAQLWLEKGVFSYNDLERPTLFIMPGYPAMLVGLMKAFGPGVSMEQVTRGLQAVLMSGAMFILFLIGQRLFSRRAAMVGALLAALYPPLWMVSNILATEALFVPALCLLVLMAIRLVEQAGTGRAISFGLAWAAAVYVRPAIALWPGVLLGLMLVERAMPLRRLAKYSVLAGAVFATSLAPWWVRNYQVSGRFVPLTLSSGNPLWLGTYEYIPSLEDQVKYHEPYKTLVEQNDFDTRWAKQRIIEGFATDPAYWTKWYTIGKFSRFWGEMYYSIPLYKLPVQLVKGLHYSLVVLGFLGAWAARRDRAARVIISLLAYMTVIHLIILADARYSAPLIPFLALFAGFLLTSLPTSGSGLVRHSAPP